MPKHPTFLPIFMHKFYFVRSFCLLFHPSFSPHRTQPIFSSILNPMSSLPPLIFPFYYVLLFVILLSFHLCIAPYKALLSYNRFHQRFLLAKEEYMVIKGCAAKRDRRGFTQLLMWNWRKRKKEKRREEYGEWMGKGRIKKEMQLRKGKNEKGRTEKAWDKEGLEWPQEMKAEGRDDFFNGALQCCVKAHVARMEMRLMLC